MFPEGRTIVAMPASPAIIPPRRPAIRRSSDLAALASSVSSVFFFGGGEAEGTKDMKAILGGKGANLAEMTNLGVPVPPGFTIACSLCNAYLRDQHVPGSLRDEVHSALERLERVTGKRFDDPTNPLLVSVRSGAP